MNLRERNEQGIIKIGVIESYGTGNENAIIPFEMVPHYNNEQWTNHATDVIEVIRSFIPNAEIYLVKKNEQGIKYLIEQGVAIINMSLAGMGEQPIEYLLKDKAFLVCAVGNSGEGGESWSAQKEFWCGVGAVGFTNIPKKYSSYGKGAVMTVAQLPIINGVIMQGTSFTSPVIVGLLGQWYIWHKRTIGGYPGIAATNQFIKQNSHDIFEDGKDLKTGYGLLRLPKKFEGEKVVITEGEQIAYRTTYVEGEPNKIKEIDLLKSAEIIDGRLVAPFRGVANAFNKRTMWDPDKHQATFL